MFFFIWSLLGCIILQTGDNALARDDDGDGYSEFEGDCDDNDPNSTIVDIDGDCDGILTDDDCDDNDPNTITDMDCDGAQSNDDCDDSDESLGAQSMETDCDGAQSAGAGYCT